MIQPNLMQVSPHILTSQDNRETALGPSHFQWRIGWEGSPTPGFTGTLTIPTPTQQPCKYMVVTLEEWVSSQQVLSAASQETPALAAFTEPRLDGKLHSACLTGRTKEGNPCGPNACFF